MPPPPAPWRSASQEEPPPPARARQPEGTPAQVKQYAVGIPDYTGRRPKIYRFNGWAKDGGATPPPASMGPRLLVEVPRLGITLSLAGEAVGPWAGGVWESLLAAGVPALAVPGVVGPLAEGQSDEGEDLTQAGVDELAHSLGSVGTNYFAYAFEQSRLPTPPLPPPAEAPPELAEGLWGTGPEGPPTTRRRLDRLIASERARQEP